MLTQLEKNSVYHTVNDDHALFHTSKTAKMTKVISLSSTLTRNFCKIVSTQRRYRHFFIAWHSAVRNSHLTYISPQYDLSRLGSMTSYTTTTFIPTPGEQFYNVKVAPSCDLTEK